MKLKLTGLMLLMIIQVAAAAKKPALADLAWAFNVSDFGEKVRILQGFYGRDDVASLIFLDNLAEDSTDIVIRLSALYSMCSSGNRKREEMVRDYCRDKNLLVAAMAINNMLYNGCNDANEIAAHAFRKLNRNEYNACLTRLKLHPEYSRIKNRYLVDSYDFIMELIIGSCARSGIKPPLKLVKDYADSHDFALIYPLECCITNLETAMKYTEENSDHPLRAKYLSASLGRIGSTGHKPVVTAISRFLDDYAAVGSSHGGRRVCDAAFDAIFLLFTGEPVLEGENEPYPDIYIRMMKQGIEKEGTDFNPDTLFGTDL